MPNNTLIFIRHAKTEVDKSVPIENWILTDDGYSSAQKLADEETFDDVDLLISSDEEKAFLTLKPLADKLRKKIVRVSDLGEIKRPNSERLTLEQYNQLKEKMLKDPNYTEQGWETANHALIRFTSAIEKINRENNRKRILIAAHGTVLTLYFANLQNKMQELFSRWSKMEFGGYGIVKDGKVIKDII